MLSTAKMACRASRRCNSAARHGSKVSFGPVFETFPRLFALETPLGLVSGGVYMHPESSKKLVAMAILSGLRRAKGVLPTVRLAYDCHAFEDAFQEIERARERSHHV